MQEGQQLIHIIVKVYSDLNVAIITLLELTIALKAEMLQTGHLQSVVRS